MTSSIAPLVNASYSETMDQNLTSPSGQLSHRTQELMAESGLSWRDAWRMAESELPGGPPRSRYGGKSKWLRLSLVGLVTPFAAIAFAIVVALLEEFAAGLGRELASLPISILAGGAGILMVVGVALIPVGVIGWVVSADNWGDRFARLIRVGLGMIPVGLWLAFSMAFATSLVGTDGGKLAVAGFFLLWTPIGILIAMFSYIGRRTYDQRAAPDRP